jgi:ribosome biogenesis GTPase
MLSLEVPPGLEDLGWCPLFHAQLLSLTAADAPLHVRSLNPARVMSQRRGEYVLALPGASQRAVLAGRLRHELTPESLPCVGDWVLFAPGDPARIEHVLERRTVFRRKAAGSTSHEQSIAANVDHAFIVAALSSATADAKRVRHELSLRRLERYLHAAAQARVHPVVVLNKADLSEASWDIAEATREALNGVDVVAVSAASGAGMAELTARIGRGETAVLVGSSGVGKSSLTNRLLGRDVQVASAVRDDDGRGRHTTTARELFLLRAGGVLIDTPGMRELGIAADAQDGSAFDDIESLAAECRFSDCGHDREPGCAVHAAIASGALTRERFENAQRLALEHEYQRSRTDVRARLEASKRSKAAARALRQRLSAKGRT